MCRKLLVCIAPSNVRAYRTYSHILPTDNSGTNLPISIPLLPNFRYGGSSPKSYPTFSCVCKASRKPDYFYWNIFIVLYFINSLSFTTFCVDPEKAQFRLALSFTLVLTTVQFKFVINR